MKPTLQKNNQIIQPLEEKKSTFFPTLTTIYNDCVQLLNEDIRDKDLTAALIPKTLCLKGELRTRESAVFCGRKWVDTLCQIVEPTIHVEWLVDDGDFIEPNQPVCLFGGSVSGLLSVERSIINILQTLSGTATQTNRYAQKISHTNAKLLDTRKTIPGLRVAQKYAVLCGGGYNHRMGLYDGILIKENHIIAAGSIMAAVKRARALYPSFEIEVEVETLTELEQVYLAGVNRVLLDNFNVSQLELAVKRYRGKVILEASGGITLNNVAQVAATGVDYISVGDLTKNLQSIDFSFRFFESKN